MTCQETIKLLSFHLIVWHGLWNTCLFPKHRIFIFSRWPNEIFKSFQFVTWLLNQITHRIWGKKKWLKQFKRKWGDNCIASRSLMVLNSAAKSNLFCLFKKHRHQCSSHTKKRVLTKFPKFYKTCTQQQSETAFSLAMASHSDWDFLVLLIWQWNFFKCCIWCAWVLPRRHNATSRNGNFLFLGNLTWYRTATWVRT